MGRLLVVQMAILQTNNAGMNYTFVFQQIALE